MGLGGPVREVLNRRWRLQVDGGWRLWAVGAVEAGYEEFVNWWL